MKEAFKKFVGNRSTRELLTTVNDIIEEYQADGYVLTLRQLYYQLVSKDLIANDDKQYKKLSRILKESRLAGVTDWSAIEDRLRTISKVPTWDDPKDILIAAKNQFRYDRLQGQETYLEVWVEKDALSEVVKRAATPYQVPVMVNRGYGSVSAMYDTCQRLRNRIDHEPTGNEEALILYLGDHDPSGLDMVRDIDERLSFMLSKYGLEDNFRVEHIALTMEQIKEYNPPPNPAKLSDARAKDYVAKYGRVSWEVDALSPPVLNDLVTKHIKENLDLAKYEEWEKKEAKKKKKIEKFIKKFR